MKNAAQLRSSGSKLNLWPCNSGAVDMDWEGGGVSKVKLLSDGS